MPIRLIIPPRTLSPLALKPSGSQKDSRAYSAPAFSLSRRPTAFYKAGLGRIRTLVVAFVALLSLGCGDDPTSPLALDGTYTLATIDGSSLPYAVEGGTPTVSGEFSFTSNSRFHYTERLQGFGIVSERSGDYSGKTSAITLKVTHVDGSPQAFETWTGKISGNQLTVTGKTISQTSNHIRVYNKQ